MSSRGQDPASILQIGLRAALMLTVALALMVFAMPSTRAQTYNVLYRFGGGADGTTPYAGLVLDASGNRYGTTTAGGASNLGTVFKLDTTGAETVLHNFAGGADGATPGGLDTASGARSRRSNR